MDAALPESSRKTIRLWLGAVCVLILTMIAIGGVTRLTGSGLSIVDWKPIMGAIPPLNEADWNFAFARYQEFPQYKLINQTMTLHEFKSIFFWEYFHRLVGRLIGVVFLLPFLWLLFRGKIGRTRAWKFSLGFALGGAQGLMGWIMVKSGLVDKPHVSHFRLAAHLSLALLVLSYLLWLFLDHAPRGSLESKAPASSRARSTLLAFLGLVVFQLIFGAFVAGLKAGFAYNTFPKMMGSWISPDAFQMEPFWMNIVENPAMIQFIHRTLGWSVLVGAIGTVYVLTKESPLTRMWIPAMTILGLVVAQFTLGVSTLLLGVPTSLAVLHQIGGSLVLLSCVWAIHRAQTA